MTANDHRELTPPLRIARAERFESEDRDTDRMSPRRTPSGSGFSAAVRSARSPVIRSTWAASGLAIASGLAGVSAFPRFGWWPMAIVSIVGFTVAVHGRSGRGSLGLGYLYGWAFFGPLLAWTGTYVGPVWLLLPFAEAGFLRRAGRRDGSPAPAARRAGVDGRGLGGRRGAARPASRSAASRGVDGRSASPPHRCGGSPPSGGAPLVTFAVALIGSALATALLAALHCRRWLRAVAAARRSSSAWSPPSRSRCSPSRSRCRCTGARPRSTTTIALIQGDVPDRGLEFNARRRQVLDNHVQQTLKLAAEVKAGTVPAPELVVWPENASDIDPFQNPDAYAQIEKAVHAINRPDPGRGDPERPWTQPGPQRRHPLVADDRPGLGVPQTPPGAVR